MKLESKIALGGIGAVVMTFAGGIAYEKREEIDDAFFHKERPEVKYVTYDQSFACGKWDLRIYGKSKPDGKNLSKIELMCNNELIFQKQLNGRYAKLSLDGSWQRNGWHHTYDDYKFKVYDQENNVATRKFAITDVYFRPDEIKVDEKDENELTLKMQANSDREQLDKDAGQNRKKGVLVFLGIAGGIYLLSKLFGGSAGTGSDDGPFDKR